ncbi:unnamed protein product, partial [Staurois parvus]
MTVLCTAIQNSVPELTGRRTVNSSPHQRCSVITECLRVITGRNIVIDSCDRKWHR